MVSAIKKPDDAQRIYNLLPADQQWAVHDLIAKGTPKLHALNLVRSQHMQDVVREGVQADEETRDPTQAEQLGAAGMGAADAATFGLGDEARGVAIGAKRALVDGQNFGDAYESGRDDARAFSQGKLAGSFGAGQLAGTAAQAGLGLGAGVAGVGTGLAGNAAEQGIKLGAATGALGGFGEGSGAVDSIKKALMGGVAGAALGGAPGAVAGEIASRGAPAVAEGVTAAPEEAAPSTADASPGGVVDLLRKIREMPGPAKAILRHVPLAGKAINIVDSLAEFGLLKKSPEASAAPAPELDSDALRTIMKNLGIADPNAPSSAPAAKLADADIPPSMQAARATPSTPASPDWHFTPDGETPIPPEAQAEMDAIAARVKGEAVTPPSSTSSMRSPRGKIPSPQADDHVAALAEQPDSGERAAALKNLLAKNREAPEMQPMADAVARSMPLAPKQGAPLSTNALKEAARAAVKNGEPMKALAKRLGVRQSDIAAFYKGAQLGG